MDYIQGFDSNQILMISFDEFVKQDSWARVVDLFVECLLMNSLGFKHQTA
jgi:hypothetical protein